MTGAFWLLLAAAWAGAQNALAGGGTFVTLPALLLWGLDPLSANVTSTVALFPSQVVSGMASRRSVVGPPGLPAPLLLGIAGVGGLAGAGLLLVTPVAVFTRLVPWLVLFATGVFAWGSYVRRPLVGEWRRPRTAAAVQGLIGVYGGYFGGGIGFLILALLTGAGVSLRAAGATKNALAAVINLGAVLVFVLSPAVQWQAAALVCVGSTAGGFAGSWALQRLPERVLRGTVVVIGLVLAAGLFLR